MELKELHVWSKLAKGRKTKDTNNNGNREYAQPHNFKQAYGACFNIGPIALI